MTDAAVERQGASSPTPRQYLTFVLADEVFALEIERVREVLEVTAITRVPRSPDFVRGVINLRGAVVPIIDLRHKLELGATDMTVDTCIVIVEVTIDRQRQVVGVLADSVKEVVDLSNEQIDSPPQMGASIDSTFLAGMCRSGDRFTMLLDIDAAFSKDELQKLQAHDEPSDARSVAGADAAVSDEATVSCA